MKRNILKGFRLSRDFESVVSTISPLRHCWFSAAFRGFLRDYAASFGTIWTGTLHKTIHKENLTNRTARILPRAFGWRILLALLCLFALPVRAGEIQRVLILERPFAVNGNPVLQIVLRSDYREGSLFQEVSGVLGSSDGGWWDFSGSCHQYSTASKSSYRCSLPTEIGWFKLEVNANPWPGEWMGSFSYSENGKSVMTSFGRVKLAAE